MTRPGRGRERFEQARQDIRWAVDLLNRLGHKGFGDAALRSLNYLVRLAGKAGKR